MLTSARSAFLHCSRTTSLTSRTAVYGPVRTVVRQGSAGDCRPYADLVRFSDRWASCCKTGYGLKWNGLNLDAELSQSPLLIQGTKHENWLEHYSRYHAA